MERNFTSCRDMQPKKNQGYIDMFLKAIVSIKEIPFLGICDKNHWTENNDKKAFGICLLFGANKS